MGKSRIDKFNNKRIEKLIAKDHMRLEMRPPQFMYKGFEIDEIKQGKSRCYRLRPRTNFNGVYIIYLYGSYTCLGMKENEWEFLSELALETGVGLFVPMYPLAPEHTCHEVFDMLKKAYSNFVLGHDVSRVILMGSSTGAGLALSLTLLAWKDGYRKPDQLIMLSPSMDTEFFDKELEAKVMEKAVREKRCLFNENVKRFINDSWVKDYAVKTEYTSPYYEDLTDLCDDVVIFSGQEDILNCYSVAFYKKAKLQGVNIRFYEFEGEKHNFLVVSDSKERRHAMGYLKDVVSGKYEESLVDIYPLKLISDWSKKYPEIIKDDWAMKFVYGNKFHFSELKTSANPTRNIIRLASYGACDERVRMFIKQYPNCTIVNLGCGLDNMFKRLDNGRIQWFSVDSRNVISLRRAMYGDLEREKTVGRALEDLTWLDEVTCDRSRGIMFVSNDALTYLSINSLREMTEAIRKKFPGAELVFTAETKETKFFDNIGYMKKSLVRRKKRLCVGDAQKIFGNWSADNRIMGEEPLMAYFNEKKGLSLRTRIFMAYNKISINRKIIRVKLGAEAYSLNDVM